MKKILKISALLVLFGLLFSVMPTGTMAKNENNKGKSEKQKSSISVEVEDDAEEDNEESEDGEKVEKKKGFFWRIKELLTSGAGKSGKIPPGLQHAPGIQKKLEKVATTTPALVAISDISVSKVSSTTVKIAWETNVPTISKFYFSTLRPVGTTSEQVAKVSRSGMSHSVELKNLATSTTYYYKITALDAYNNLSTTGELSFATAGGVIGDTTAPIISSVRKMSIGTTTNILWETNELATSKVWLGTTTPVIGATSTLSIATSTLSTEHALRLPELVASTTYYFRVSSSDAAGNSSTSDEFNFIR